jgi:hypothetical protein
MPTQNLDSLTNSLLMALAKEAAKHGIDLYRPGRNKMFREMIRAELAVAKADSLNERILETARAAFKL